ncbi:MAG: hypothetical protein M5U09_18525 [Gammaproteobacteria bacterium]|nr:hypothetical protein [Gammaproteobacteria bacterium]
MSAAPCRRGDAVYFRAWMRSPEQVPVDFIFEVNAPPNTKDISQTVQLTPEWKEYRFAGRCRQPYETGGAMIKFFLGRKAGVVEVAGIRCDNFGAATGYPFDETIDFWSGRPHDDAWRAAANQRIEQISEGRPEHHRGRCRGQTRAERADPCRPADPPFPVRHRRPGAAVPRRQPRQPAFPGDGQAAL